MFKHFAVILFLGTHGVAACDDNGESLAVRNAIYSGDIDTVETLLSRHQTRFEAGERTAEDTRCLFRHFTKMRPETFAFVEDWRRAYPASPYAATAQAWANYVVSWQVRGEKAARETYPLALREFSRLQRTGWELAESAYRSKPRLIAASDALIKYANPMGQHDRRATVLAEVMATDPNKGTLTRAVGQIFRGWGGTWDMGAAFCDTYAPLLPEADDREVTRCKLPLARNFKDQWDWMNTTLKTGDYPDFDYLRLDFIFGSERDALDRADLELVHRVLSQDDYLLIDHLSDYDMLAAQHGLPLMTETVTKRRYAMALKEYDHNPLAIWVLDILSRHVSTSLITDDGVLRIQVLSEPTDEQALEYAQRRVAASPYNPDAWTDLLSQLMRADRITHLLQSEPYRINAIAYDNHNPPLLSSYLFSKFRDYDLLQKAHDGQLPPDLMAMVEGVDEERDMICPILRAARLLDHSCETRPHPACMLAPDVEGAVATLETRAKRQNICSRERRLPAATLAYSPVSVDAENY